MVCVGIHLAVEVPHECANAVEKATEKSMDVEVSWKDCQVLQSPEL